MSRADDIARLFQGIGASTDGYLEMDSRFDYPETTVTPLRPLRTVSEASSVAPTESPLPPTASIESASASPAVVSASLSTLLAEVARAREAQTGTGTEDQQPPQYPGQVPQIKARVIAVVSAKGGVGKTTLSAALASLLQLPGGRTMVVEFDPQDALRHHLLGSAEQAGLAHGSLCDMNWNDLLVPGAGNTWVLPYGSHSAAQRRTLKQALAEDRHWLARQIERMQLGEHDVLVLDVATGPSLYLEQALEVADQVLAMINTDAACYQTLDVMEQWLAPLAGRPQPPVCHYVINQFDASRAFSCDMHQVLLRRLGDRLLGWVRLDHSLAEALAYGTQPLLAEQPTLGVQDLLALGQKLTLRLMDQARAESSPS
ncbi:cellulose biosynthesis protein BcsQ [Pseudomonas putida]|uniref:cellulose biosynthesis protein BcsQ n=1 Tax=Pseudomonas putida TaxID=303 RepID=UPI00370B2853